MMYKTIFRIEPAPEQKWFEGWRTNPAAKEALHLFEEKIGRAKRHAHQDVEIAQKTQRDIDITRHRILIACFNAAHYEPDADPGQKYRESIKGDEEQFRSDLIDSVHKLVKSAQRNDKALLWAMAIAENISGVRLTRKEKPEPMTHKLVAEKYFLALEDALKGPLPEFDGGPFLHRFTIGNLIFDRSLAGKEGRKVTTKTMLAFELAFYLRQHTAGHARDGHQQGVLMPQYGQPHYSVVAAFVRAALGEWCDGGQIEDALQRYSKKKAGVGLVSWPNTPVLIQTKNNAN